jgi:glycosyltransferase involved in cell wall biosynthesis
MHAQGKRPLTVTLVATTLNEYGSIPGWLAGLRTQSRFPDHFIVVDGGSDDGTQDALRSARMPFPMEMIVYPGASISEGRNRAISRAAGDIVVVTDAGTRAERCWLQRLVEPLESDESLDVVAGFFEGLSSSFWTRTLTATSLPAAQEVDPERFLASSRSFALRKRWLDLGFAYPEWLDYCEDVVLDLQLRRAGAKQYFAADARVYFEPRGDPLAFFRQYYRYARGDGKAGLFARRHALRYATYGVACFVLVRRRPHEVSLVAALGLAYIFPAIKRYRAMPGNPSSLWFGMGNVMVVIGFQRYIGDFAKMLGYPAGLTWRLKRDRAWRLWKSTWANRMPSGDLPRF